MPRPESSYYVQELNYLSKTALRGLNDIEEDTFIVTWQDFSLRRNAGYEVSVLDGTLERIHHTIDENGRLVRPRVNPHRYVYYYDRRLEQDPLNPEVLAQFFVELPKMVDMHMELQSSGKNR